MNKNKVVIRLMGHDYTLVTEQTPQQVHRVARYVDRKMREISITSRSADAMVTTLTAVTIADELMRAQDENLRLKRELAELRSQQQT